jgi:hypothetical protein
VEASAELGRDLAQGARLTIEGEAPVHERADAVGRRSGVLRWRVLVPLFFLGGVAWGLMTAPMGVPDEPAYAVHAVAFWSGQWSSDPSPHVDRPRALPFGNGRWYQIPDVWTDGYDVPVCFAYHPERPALCANFSGSSDPTAVADTLSYTVQPAWLVMAGLPGRLFPGLVGMYGMRLVSALVGAVLLAAAVRALADVVAARLALVGVLAATTPMAFTMIGSVNPNGLEIASAICLWGHALALGRRPAPPPRRLLVGLVVSATVLAFTRPLSPIFVAVILAVAAVAGGGKQLGALWADRRARLAGAVLVAVEVVALVLVYLGSRATGSPTASLLRPSVLRTRIVEAIATFGWSDTHVWPVVALWALGLGTLVVAGLVLGRNPTRVALLLVVAASAGLLVVRAVPGAGSWQGRYGLPITVGVALTSVVAIGDGWSRVRPTLRWLLPALTGLFGVAMVIAFVRALQRFTVGISPRTSVLDVFHGGWEPPGGAAFVLALIVAFVGLAFVAVLCADDTTVADDAAT